MKSFKLNISFIFILTTLFLVSGSNAFAFEKISTSKKNTQATSFTVESNSQSVVCNEISVSVLSISRVQSPSLYVHFFSSNILKLKNTEVVEFNNSYTNFQFRDRRNLIAKQLFPTHFFW